MLVVLLGDWMWPSMSNWVLKSKFTPFWVCQLDKSPLIEVMISIFGPKKYLTTVIFPVDFRIEWPCSLDSFYISNQFHSAKLCVPYLLASFCIYSMRPSPVSVPHPIWFRTYPDFIHAEKVAPWTVKRSSCITWRDNWSSASLDSAICTELYKLISVWHIIRNDQLPLRKIDALLLSDSDCYSESCIETLLVVTRSFKSLNPDGVLVSYEPVTPNAEIPLTHILYFSFMIAASDHHTDHIPCIGKIHAWSQNRSRKGTIVCLGAINK